jgi:hypothetical protein
LKKRIAEMNVAREWLARTETDLQALDKDAQNMLRMTSSLIERESARASGRSQDSVRSQASGRSKASGGKGAPPPRDRDNIIKLRRQGWTVEEIANALDMAKGEVELVLELSPKD